MKIVKIVSVTKDEEQIDDIFCNNCGESMKRSCGYEGLVETEITGGFDSELGDGTSYRFSICEKCLDKMFNEFKSPPAIANYMMGTDFVQPKDMAELNSILDRDAKWAS